MDCLLFINSNVTVLVDPFCHTVLQTCSNICIPVIFIEDMPSAERMRNQYITSGGRDERVGGVTDHCLGGPWRLCR